jgi:hypothetical protein
MVTNLLDCDYNISTFVCALPLDVVAKLNHKVDDEIEGRSSTNSQIVRV